MRGFVRTCLGLVLVLLGAAAAGPTRAAEPLVSVAWVSQNLRTPNVFFLDVQSVRNYERRHVPGAIHTRYPEDGWRKIQPDGRIGLPTPVEFAGMMSKLGVRSTDHVVLVATGGSDRDMSIATDIYWTLLYFGHEEVSILDGGLVAFNAAGGARDREVRPRPPSEYVMGRRRAGIMAAARDAVGSMGVGAMADHRPQAQWLGLNKVNYVPVAGSIPTANSLPGDWLMKDGGGFFRSKEDLTRIFEYAKVATQGKTIHIGNTSMEGSLGWFAAYEILGNKNARLYAGGMADWGRDPQNPVRVHLGLEDASRHSGN